MPSAAADAADSVRRRSTSVSPSREVVGRLAVGAVGAHDEHDAVALGRGPRHRTTRQPGLVVGMGVDEHDRGHSVAEGIGGPARRPYDGTATM